MTIWSAIRARPIAALAAAGVLGTGGVGTGTAGYWVYVQPDPQIVAMEAPTPNGGMSGIAPETRAHPVAAGVTPPTKTVFRAGETLWTLRHDCFLFKTSGPITRAFIGKRTGTIYHLPLTYPPTRTEGCARRNFATPIPKDLPPDDYIYEVAVLFYKNPIQPEVRTAFPPVHLTVVP